MVIRSLRGEVCVALDTLGWILGGVGLCMQLAFLGYWKYSGKLFLIFGVFGAILLVSAMILVAVG